MMKFKEYENKSLPRKVAKRQNADQILEANC